MQETDAFIQAAKRTPVDLRAWAVSMMERTNRKSHLGPQLSPPSSNAAGRQAMPFGSTIHADGSSPPASTANAQTPTAANMDLYMAGLSIDPEKTPSTAKTVTAVTPGSARPYPIRTSSSATTASANGIVYTNGRPSTGPQTALPPLPSARKIGS